MDARKLLPGLLAVAFVLTITSGSAGQAALPRFETPRAALARELEPQETGKTGLSAFAIEAVGASVGSALGFGAIYLSTKDECDVEDLGCNLENAATGIAVGTAAAALGDYIAGRLGHTNPSASGAIVGAVAGAAAGIGMWHLLTEDLDLVNKSEAATAVYVLTQGVVTALGSRIVRALK
jgi:hypothetical protein